MTRLPGAVFIKVHCGWKPQPLAFGLASLAFGLASVAFGLPLNEHNLGFPVEKLGY